MFHLRTRIAVAVLYFAAPPALLAPWLRAQSPLYRTGPGMNLQQFMNQGPGLNGFSSFSGSPAFNANPNATASMVSSPYASAYSSPYSSNGYGQYSYDPFSGYLHGSADVINAQGKFMTNQQQAFEMREQVRQETIVTRRKVFDEYLYEREKAPTAEDDRARYVSQQLSRSRNNPPTAEITSGKALNDLLADLRKVLAQNDTASLRTMRVPLDEDGLKRINACPSAGKGNLALLKDGGKLAWPLVLTGPEFKDQRERLNALVQAAVKQAEFNNQVDAGTIRQLTDDVARMQRELRRLGTELPPSPYIEAKSYLNNLETAIAALQQRNVGSYFTGKYALKGKTVPELVQYMNAEGLWFAPAVAGEEASYRALYQALVQYDLAAQPTTAER
jgi:hypothetical protein